MDIFLNPRARREPCRPLFTDADLAGVRAFFESRRDIAPTRLVHLHALASRFGIADVMVKDESTRLGLNAFKAAGVEYAVGRIEFGATLACATEGNHGRAVAHAARTRGLRAVVYMRDSAAPARIAAIRGEGAEIVLTPGTYDDAVKRMAEDAIANGWTIVSDTSWPGYEDIPRAIMAGYTHIMNEAAREWGETPDVVVVQAGVGGLAGAVASWLCAEYGSRRPYLICAEPTGAACVRASIEAGRPTSVTPGDTAMNGLRCGEMSIVALPPLMTTVDACVTVDDDVVMETIERLGAPLEGDPVVSAGPSGACGLAALGQWLTDKRCERSRREAGIAPGSRALVINTEGASETATRSDGHRPAAAVP